MYLATPPQPRISIGTPDVLLRSVRSPTHSSHNPRSQSPESPHASRSPSSKVVRCLSAAETRASKKGGGFSGPSPRRKPSSDGPQSSGRLRSETPTGGKSASRSVEMFNGQAKGDRPASYFQEDTTLGSGATNSFHQEGTILSTILETLEKNYQTQKAMNKEIMALALEAERTDDAELAKFVDPYLSKESAAQPVPGSARRTEESLAADALEGLVQFVKDVVCFASPAGLNMPQLVGRPTPKLASWSAAGRGKDHLHSFFDVLKVNVDESVFNRLTHLFIDWQMAFLESVQDFVSKGGRLIEVAPPDRPDTVTPAPLDTVSNQGNGLRPPQPVQHHDRINDPFTPFTAVSSQQQTPPFTARMLAVDSFPETQLPYRTGLVPEGPAITGNSEANLSNGTMPMVELISGPASRVTSRVREAESSAPVGFVPSGSMLPEGPFVSGKAAPSAPYGGTLIDILNGSNKSIGTTPTVVMSGGPAPVRVSGSSGSLPTGMRLPTPIRSYSVPQSMASARTGNISAMPEIFSPHSPASSSATEVYPHYPRPMSMGTSNAGSIVLKDNGSEYQRVALKDSL